MLTYNKKFVNKLGYLRDKKILILGFGREGRETLRFLKTIFPDISLGVADKDENLRLKKGEDKDINIKWHLGENYLKALKRYDVIIKTPGISPKVIKNYLKKRQKVTSATEIFLDLCPGTIIGITGTKGKSTTSAMIYHLLKNLGFKTHLIGNIGKPALSLLIQAKPDDIFVYEMSSHQLYGLKKSPHIAVFLNIFPEHLDYYNSFIEYARAKANICLWQKKTDYLVYNSADKLVTKFAQKSKAKKIPIKGNYYQLDKSAAIAVGKIFNISLKSSELILKKFKKLPHRLEKVGIFQGITFYNDSLSTIPQSTIEALNFLGNKVETLIAGGYDRGVDFSELAKKIKHSQIKTVILFLPSGKRIAELLKNSRISIKIFFVKNMKEAIKLAFEYTSKGKICLLSPASPSFGLFKNYKDRGNRFKFYIRKLSK